MTITNNITAIDTAALNIKKGNWYDSRIGNHSYARWTEGYDVRIESPDGRVVFYRFYNYDHDVVEHIEPVKLDDWASSSWEELPVRLRAEFFYDLFPNGTEQEVNLFIYGLEIGQKMNEEIEWAEEHRVHSRKITLALKEKLGKFFKVEFLYHQSRQVGSGYRNYVYLIDGRWQVTVYANEWDGEGGFYDDFSICEYSKILAEKKVFGRRVARLTKAAGVPWDIGAFVAHLSDEEAIALLKQVKTAKESYNGESWQHELRQCGIYRRTEAIVAILGEELWNRLRCNGQGATSKLADYLATK